MGQTISTVEEYSSKDIELTTAAVNANKRKLVTIRRIDELNPIVGKDIIEVATVEGWKVVVKKGEFNVGDRCVYFEIDSFLPDGNPAWQFLVDKSSRVMDGKRGHKLRTVKLGGQVSQGLALPLRTLPVVQLLCENPSAAADTWNFMAAHGLIEGDLPSRVEAMRILERLVDDGEPERSIDLSNLLGIEKYEAPLPAELIGQAEGLFPSFIKKTDQERCQNLCSEIFGYDETSVVVDIEASVVQDAIDAGRLKLINGVVHRVEPPKASPDDRYEITVKMDGSSMTVFRRDGEVGVCSRNLQLKINDANKDNSFVRMMIDGALDTVLEALEVLPEFVTTDACKVPLKNIAIQGELMGPGIQGNREQFTGSQFFIFDIYFIDENRYATPAERLEIFERMKLIWANSIDGGVNTKVHHTPILHESITLGELGLNSIDDLLAFAEGPSLNHPIREGLVFKRADGLFSFKAISNTYLAKEKD